MAVVLKPERRTKFLSAACTAKLKQNLKDFAKQNEVSESTAIHYILELFFEMNSEKIEVQSEKLENTNLEPIAC